MEIERLDRPREVVIGGGGSIALGAAAAAGPSLGDRIRDFLGLSNEEADGDDDYVEGPWGLEWDERYRENDRRCSEGPS